MRQVLTFGLFTFVAYMSAVHLSVPNSELGRELYRGICQSAVYGVIAAVIITAYRNLMNVANVLAKGVATGLFVVMVSGYVLDDAILHPTSAIVVLVSVAVLIGVYHMAISSGTKYEPTAETFTVGKAVQARYGKPSERDRKSIAAHEAGHALLYAAVKDALPESFHVCIRDRMELSGSLGYVSGLELQDCLLYRTESEWEMLVLLAGKLGELSVNRYDSLGATGDMKRWFELAIPYLSNQYQGVFYPHPACEQQEINNQNQINALKKNQTQLLTRFFCINGALLKEMTAALLEKNILKRNEVMAFLDRVTFPEGFPAVSR